MTGSFEENWSVRDVRMRVEISHEEVVVECELDVAPNDGRPGAFVLDGRALVTEHVVVDGQSVSLDAIDAENRTLTLSLSEGWHTVSTRVRARVGAPGDKGFVSHAGLLSTNLEPQGFRRITWFPDRPSVRPVFDVTVVGNSSDFPVLLANGSCVERGVLDDGRHWARFDDPVPKPSYLFAMVAGDLQMRSLEHESRSESKVKLTVAAPPDMIDGADFALRVLDDAMTFDEEAGAPEHDLPELIYAAIPGYPDATEYHGLMFFDPSILVADMRGHSDDDLLLISANVVHEYGHHARGNRVTVRTWGELALKEGLTVLTAQNDYRRHQFGPAARILDVLDLRRLQFPEELTMGAPVLRGEVDDPTSLYNRTTYLKGAEIFSMLRVLVGDETWSRAMATFNSRFELSAAAVADFVETLIDVAPQRESGIRAVSRWFTLVNRPSVEFKVGVNRLSATRVDALLDDPVVGIPVKVGFIGADGASVAVSVDGASPVSELVLLMDSREAEWSLDCSLEFTVSLMRGYSAPIDYAVNYSMAELAQLVRFDSDKYVKWWAAQELMIRTIDAHRGGHEATSQEALSALVDALRVCIADSDDPVLIAQLLAVPDEFMLGDRDKIVDIDGTASGLALLRSRLGAALADDLVQLWSRWIDSGAARASGIKAIAARMLVEPVLALLIASHRHDALALAQAAVSHAEPTVGIRAFAQLAHSDAIDFDELASRTYELWKHSPRLVDRWLRAQTGSRRIDTIERVKKLSHGPLYDRNDRSRVMAIWFPFATRNRSVFHHISGAGYRVFTDELGQLLAVNAGTAVRLVGDLLQFKRFDDVRSRLMRAELERLVEMPGLPDFAVGIVRSLLA